MAETFLYLTLGTRDLSRATRFYDAALAPLGLVRRATKDTEVGYGLPDDRHIRLWITLPFDGRPATAGNGSMPAFVAHDQQAVRAFHAAALAQGGTDEGGPGLRPYGPAFFAAYVRDPDGNKLSVVHQGLACGPIGCSAAVRTRLGPVPVPRQPRPGTLAPRGPSA